MDSLLELIDSRIEKALAKSNCVNSQIAQVISVGDSTCEVKLFTTGAKYTIPNYSGSDVRAGQLVHVYWIGGFISNQSAYIGAALTNTGATFVIPCQKSLVSLIQTDQSVARVRFTNQAKTYVIINFNAVIENESSGNVTFQILFDETALAYTPKLTTVVGFNHCSFNVYIPIEELGDHTIEIVASGVGDIIQVDSCLSGQGIYER